jgi:hypothetical protein
MLREAKDETDVVDQLEEFQPLAFLGAPALQPGPWFSYV